MKQKNNELELVRTINRILNALDTNFKANSKKTKRISYNDLLLLFKDLNDLFEQYSVLNAYEAADLCISKTIPMLNFICKIDNNKLHLVEYEKLLKNAYKLAARHSFEHFVIYYEWDLPMSEKFFLPRYEILSGYAYFLNKMTFDDSFEMIIANLPSGAGKTYLEKLSILLPFIFSKTFFISSSAIESII